jgi:hypothetical protein
MMISNRNPQNGPWKMGWWKWPHSTPLRHKLILTYQCVIKRATYMYERSRSYLGQSRTLKPHCIRCSHFKVDDISALEASSNRSVHIVEDNVTASQNQQRTPWPWMPWRCDVDLLVPAGTSTRLDWIQCGFNTAQTMLNAYGYITFIHSDCLQCIDTVHSQPHRQQCPSLLCDLFTNMIIK